ncbi:MAG: hypothetical protein PHN51_01445 [Candidatus Nanopelagicales bacterium]|nr:hypothetical protein [Candidatus Nanopelagicales bacterium]
MRNQVKEVLGKTRGAHDHGAHMWLQWVQQARFTPITMWIFGAVSALTVALTWEVSVAWRVLAAFVVGVMTVASSFLLATLIRGVWSLVLVSAVVGVVRAVTFALVVAVSQHGEHWLGPLRFINAVLAALVWLPASSIIVAKERQYRTRYQDLVHQVAVRNVARHLEGLAEVSQLKSALADAATTVEPTQQDLDDAAAAIRWEIEHRIRPLSHRIWFSGQSREPHARYSMVIRDAIVGFTVPIVPVVLLWWIVATIGAPVLFGTQRGVLSAAVNSAFFFLALTLSARVIRSWPNKFLAPLLVLASVYLPVIAADLVMNLQGSWVNPAAPIVTYAFVPFAMLFLVIGSASLKLDQQDRTQILKVIEERVDTLTPLEHQAMSSYLHNTLQSELTGLALQLDQATPGTKAAEESWERLAALVNRSIAQDFHKSQLTPLQRIERIQQAWQGIAAIDLDIAASVDVSDSRLSLVVAAIEEVVTNAVRRAGATQITFSLTNHGEDLHLDARTNALLNESAPLGMGNVWLGAVLSEQIKVDSDEFSTRLQLVF